MSHVDHHMKVDNKRPYLRVTLEDENGTAVNLTASNAVLFSMEARDTTTPKISRAVANVVNPPGTDGIVEYRWGGANDTDTEDIYFGEFIVDWDGAGDEVTFPNDGYIVIKVKEKVA